jgi:D-alanine-D-alanine ligase
MKIALLFDGASALGTRPDLLILDTVEAIERVLVEDGHGVVRVPVHEDARWVERLRRGKFDLAFNMCEGIDGIAAMESPVIAVLELLDLPYTGATSWTTALCLRKHLTNSVLDRAGLPVPGYGVARRGGAIPAIEFPAICKPAAEDASLGVEQGSVVRSGRALRRRLTEMHERWDEVMVQRFVDGREVNVGIVAGDVLPIAEIRFDDMPRGKWQIVTYRSKWDTGSDEDRGTTPQCPADLDGPLAKAIRRVALDAWRAVGGTGYGRVDLRVDAHGQPWILEVNANPDIAPDAGLARMARVAGMDYAALIRAVCDEGLARERPLPSAVRWAMSERLSGMASSDGALDAFA